MAESVDPDTGEVWEDSAAVGEKHGFSDAQIAALRDKLDRRRVASREQAGHKLSYIEGWWAIREANRIFGFDGWQRETVEMRLVAEREVKIGRPPNQRDGWGVAYLCRCRVRILSGDTWIVREGTGYGSGIDVSLGAAHESGAKEAETDAMKRALMTFGNVFGLALYDKTQAEVGEPQVQKPPSVISQNVGQQDVARSPPPASSPPAPLAEEKLPDKKQVLTNHKSCVAAIDTAESADALDRIMSSEDWDRLQDDVKKLEGETIGDKVMAKLAARAQARKEALAAPIRGYEV